MLPLRRDAKVEDLWSVRCVHRAAAVAHAGTAEVGARKARAKIGPEHSAETEDIYCATPVCCGRRSAYVSAFMAKRHRQEAGYSCIRRDARYVVRRPVSRAS